MAALVTEGTLSVGVDSAPPCPMQIGCAATPGFSGFEVDLLNRIAAGLKLSVRYKSALWAEITNALRRSEIDCICTAATITPERQRDFAFSDPYLHINLAVVTAGDFVLDPNRKLDAQLENKRLGIRIATTAEEYITQHLKPSLVRKFHFNDEAYDNLKAGEVDAVVDDSPIAQYFARSAPGLRQPIAIGGTDSCYGIIVRKENTELRDKLNAALKSLEADGTSSGLRSKWLS
jgi:ABC-type amino acid transport substrate-binding protein